MEAKDKCDITISIDCDGQDDINAMDEMVEQYQKGCEIVYGVRSRRDTDTFFKRFTAEGFYKLLNWMGAEVVYNHADYRLVSSRVLERICKFQGSQSVPCAECSRWSALRAPACIMRDMNESQGESHYPLSKMLALAFDGITSLSVKPIRIITALGTVIAGLSFLGVIWSIVMRLMGNAVAGWSSMIW